MYIIFSEPRVGPYPPPGGAVAGFEPQAIGGRTMTGWGVYAELGGIDPGDLRFHPELVGFVDVWDDFRTGNGTLSPAGVAYAMYEP